MIKKITLFFCLFLSACSAPDTSWFPLTQGYWWQYSAVRSIRGEAHKQKLVLANLPEVNIDGKTLVPRKRAGGQIEYYEKTNEGIYRVDINDGSRDLEFQQPVKVGSRWQRKSKILFLEVTGAFEATYNSRIKEDILVDFEIESINDVVSVAAGRYENCVRIKGKGSLYGGGGSLEEFMNIDNINIETVEWYAPGVGLIKRTRKEYTFPVKFENHYVEELESLKTG